MERGGGSGGGGLHRLRKHAKLPTTRSGDSGGSGINLLQAQDDSNNNLPTVIRPSSGNDNNSVANRAIQATQQRNTPPHVVREQDQYMPIANVIRIMRRILPTHAKISDDAKETVQECVSEYISFITGEANERCQREQRKTITAEDVLWAMGKLGFDDYVEPLTVFLTRYRESENDRSTLCDPILKRTASDYANIGMQTYVPPFPMGDPQGIYDPTMLAAYYRDASGAVPGGSSSQNAMSNYDPFGQFK